MDRVPEIALTGLGWGGGEEAVAALMKLPEGTQSIVAWMCVCEPLKNLMSPDQGNFSDELLHSIQQNTTNKAESCGI